MGRLTRASRFKWGMSGALFRTAPATQAIATETSRQTLLHSTLFRRIGVDVQVGFYRKTVYFWIIVTVRCNHVINKKFNID